MIEAQVRCLSLVRATVPIAWGLALACHGQSPAGPSVDAVTPNRALAGESVQALITGSFHASVRISLDDTSPPELIQSARVRIGDRELPEASVSWISARQVTAGIPGTFAPGVYDVSVGTPAGRWDTLARAFTVAAAPSSGAGAGGSSGIEDSSNAGRTTGTSGATGTIAGKAGAGAAGTVAGSAGTPVGAGATIAGAAGAVAGGGGAIAGAAGAPGGAGGSLAGAGHAGVAGRIPLGGTAGRGREEAAAGAAGIADPFATGDYACPQDVDDATLALYNFERDLSDATDNHPASYSGTEEPQYVDAGPGCDLGLAMSLQYHVYIDDSPAWDLDRGAIDFWLYPSGISDFDPYSILSRDADGTAFPGHITIYLAGNGSGRIFARMQDGSELYVCSNYAPQLGTWTHVAFNFGPPRVELYINGILQDYTGFVPFYDQWVTCGIEGTHSIAGNSNPWIIGASADVSSEGESNNLRGFAQGAAIDALRISNQRRNFGPDFAFASFPSPSE